MSRIHRIFHSILQENPAWKSISDITIITTWTVGLKRKIITTPFDGGYDLMVIDCNLSCVGKNILKSSCNVLHISCNVFIIYINA